MKETKEPLDTVASIVLNLLHFLQGEYGAHIGVCPDVCTSIKKNFSRKCDNLYKSQIFERDISFEYFQDYIPISKCSIEEYIY